MASYHVLQQLGWLQKLTIRVQLPALVLVAAAAGTSVLQLTPAELSSLPAVQTAKHVPDKIMSITISF